MLMVLYFLLVDEQSNAKLCYEIMSSTPGLFCTFPNAAMYLLLGVDMARFPEFENDVDFAAGKRVAAIDNRHLAADS